ncbi:hypothetical protein WJX73_000290 [Symbiochloris irregularis]|uniref:Uncharacterized protein n=1 Tax=Symbiochloris irregularis TaxID=706552 RepID=A0AAW1PTM3_9CHLO
MRTGMPNASLPRLKKSDTQDNLAAMDKAWDFTFPCRSVEATVEKQWDMLSKGYSFMIVLGLFVLSFLTMHIGLWTCQLFGFNAMVLSLPLLYLAFAAGLVGLTVAGSNTLLPRLADGQKMRMWSPEFARWWCVCRMIDITNTFVMRYFRGTALLNQYYNLLGASLPPSVLVESLDLMDLHMLQCGEDVVLGEGSTIVGHTFKDGCIVFNHVKIERGAVVQPYSVVTPETCLKADHTLAPLGASTEHVDSLGKIMERLFAPEMASPTTLMGMELDATTTTALQVMATVNILMVAAASAVSGLYVFACFMRPFGLTIAMSPMTAVATGLVAMANPLLAIFGALTVQMGGSLTGVTAFGMLKLIWALIASFTAVPFALIGAGICQTLMSSILKRTLVGTVQPGKFRRNTVLGVAMWMSQRLVENTVQTYGNAVTGTWAVNVLYRAFGASVGDFCVIRNKTPAVSFPDMLNLGRNVVCGDTTKLVTSMPLDALTVLVAPVKVEKHGTVGAWSVLLPGVTVGEQATLAPLSVPEPGTKMLPRTVYMGAPAKAVKAETRGLPVTDIKFPNGWAALCAMPFAQVVAITSMAIISHTAAALAGHLVCMLPKPFGWLLAVLVAMSVQCYVIGRLNSYLQNCFSAAKPGAGARQWSLSYIVGCALATITIYCNCFGEQLWKGAPCWIEFMRRTGIKIGARVYIDSDWLGEPGVTYQDDAVADKGSIVFGHLLAFDGKYNHLEHRNVTVGKGAVIGPRAAVLPGVTVPSRATLQAGELRMAL